MNSEKTLGSHPTGICFFKVNNRNTKTMFKICFFIWCFYCPLWTIKCLPNQMQSVTVGCIMFRFWLRNKVYDFLNNPVKLILHNNFFIYQSKYGKHKFMEIRYIIKLNVYIAMQAPTRTITKNQLLRKIMRLFSRLFISFIFVVVCVFVHCCSLRKIMRLQFGRSCTHLAFV